MIRGRNEPYPTDNRSQNPWLARVLWIGGGFLAGAVFWHMIGFWTLVSTAVMGGPGAEPAKNVAVVARKTAHPIETGSLRSRQIPCATLALNRQRGETQLQPCQTAPFHHINGGLGTKADRAAGVASWSTTLQ